MEAIRNYLETMFRSMPNTPEVLRAKDELWQMMEDKYTELIEEGKSENEAVGTVIAEFGNLDELADELGIHQFMHTPDMEMAMPRRMISFEEVKEYLHDKKAQAVRIALGVFLCIASPIGCIIGEAVHINEGFGIAVLFACIALAVGLFVFSGILFDSKWNFLKKEPCAMDFETTDYVYEQKESNRVIFATLLVIGIGCCIISVVPVAVLDCIPIYAQVIDMEVIGGALFLFLVAVGVFLIVQGSIVNGSFDLLLKMNDEKTVGGNYVEGQKEVQYATPLMKSIMEVYWPTITCVYLIWSFLTYDWYMTWMIWPVAAIMHGVLKNMFRKQD